MGVAERVFELEADSRTEIRERWLECELNGSFRFPTHHGFGERLIEIRGKADRIDILVDGTLAVVDYKLGRLPDVTSSIQIGVYAHCARQLLEARDGKPHLISSARYLAFGDDRRLEGALGGGSDPVTPAVEIRASEFAGIVARIESGEFPVRPKRPADCQWCGYAGVCRKEYQVEADDAAEPV
jgi:RecB family exonuclease